MNIQEHDVPETLSERSKAVWRRLVPHNVRAFGRVLMLRTALEALDTADRARAEMAEAKLTTTTLGSGTLHSHPLIKVEKESRQQFVSIMTALGLSHPDRDGHDIGRWYAMVAAREAQQ